MSFKSKATFVNQDKVRKLFEKYDFNKNGVIDREEFLKMGIVRQLEFRARCKRIKRSSSLSG